MDNRKHVSTVHIKYNFERHQIKNNWCLFLYRKIRKRCLLCQIKKYNFTLCKEYKIHVLTSNTFVYTQMQNMG